MTETSSIYGIVLQIFVRMDEENVVNSMTPTQELSNSMSLRVSTDDRMKAEALRMKYRLDNNSQLVRLLINERAEQLGVN